MDKKLEDLKLKPAVLAGLHQPGFAADSDLSTADSVEIMRLPGVTGYEWRKIAKALGRGHRSDALA